MANTSIIKVTSANGTCYIPGNEEFATLAAKAIEEFNPDAIIYTYKAGKVNLDSLPEEVIRKVNEILDYFTKAYVTYMNGKFEVSACIGIQKNYPVDHFFCGTYTK